MMDNRLVATRLGAFIRQRFLWDACRGTGDFHEAVLSLDIEMLATGDAGWAG